MKSSTLSSPQALPPFPSLTLRCRTMSVGQGYCKPPSLSLPHSQVPHDVSGAGVLQLEGVHVHCGHGQPRPGEQIPGITHLWGGRRVEGGHRPTPTPHGKQIPCIMHLVRGGGVRGGMREDVVRPASRTYGRGGYEGGHRSGGVWEYTKGGSYNAGRLSGRQSPEP